MTRNDDLTIRARALAPSLLPRSLRILPGGAAIWLAPEPGRAERLQLGVLSPPDHEVVSAVVGESTDAPAGRTLLVGPADATNAETLRRLAPELVIRPLANDAAITFRDRYAAALPGFVRALESDGKAHRLPFAVAAAPENEEDRDPRRVADDATYGTFAARHERGFALHACDLRDASALPAFRAAGFVRAEVDLSDLLASDRDGTAEPRFAEAADRLAAVRAALAETDGPAEVAASLRRAPRPTEPGVHASLLDALAQRDLTLTAFTPAWPSLTDDGGEDAFLEALRAHAAVARKAGGHALTLGISEAAPAGVQAAAAALGNRLQLHFEDLDLFVALHLVARFDAKAFRTAWKGVRDRYDVQRDRQDEGTAALLERLPKPDAVKSQELESWIRDPEAGPMIAAGLPQALAPLRATVARLVGERRDVYADMVAMAARDRLRERTKAAASRS